MEDKYIQYCPPWLVAYFCDLDVDFKEPYNKDTLKYIDMLFNHGLMQEIYKIITTKYSDSEVQKALFNFIMDAWNEKIRQG